MDKMRGRINWSPESQQRSKVRKLPKVIKIAIHVS